MSQQSSQGPPTLHAPSSSSLADLSDDTMMDRMDDSDSASPSCHNASLALPLASDDTETDDDTLPTFQAPVRIFTPPPHIAARFYRSAAAVAAAAAASPSPSIASIASLASMTAAARRKSSAASSRRNSISSTHSRSSHGHGPHSLVGGTAGSGAATQSKHVAQHFRRASILADRKARLADRAAHAEQVRLRAAMAKAAVRDTTVSEERAQAAAQAREKNLAEIAATCAEEVKRAKAVAESIKEKREQNLLRLRQQIQVRLDEAERRREELRRNNSGRSRARGQSLAATSRKAVEVMPKVNEGSSDGEQEDDADGGSQKRVTQDQDAGTETMEREREPSQLTPEEAAFRILSWWRTASRRRAVAEFQQLGLAVDGVRDTSFETVVELLGQDKVLLMTGKVLRICGFQDGKTSAVKEIVAVRAFLSAFLILGHPTEVLNSKNGSSSSGGSGSSGSKSSSGKNSSSKSGKSSKSSKNEEATPSASHASSTKEMSAAKNSMASSGKQQQQQQQQQHAKAKGQQEQELVGKARDLLICFETILSRLTPANSFTPPASLSSELVEAYDSFYDAFISWKARDASALVDVMIKQFVELDAIWQTVKDGSSTSTSVSETYRQSIQQNQLLLMVRIKKLAGPEEGKKKVFEAVRQARRAKAEANKKAAAATSDLRPREADHTIETAMGDLAGPGGASPVMATAPASSTLSPSGLKMSTAAPAVGTADNTLPFGRSFAEMRADQMDQVSGSHAAAAETAETATTTTTTTTAAAADAARLMAAARPRYSSHPLPENRVVVHELALNREYRVSAEQFKKQQARWMEPVFRRMRKTMAASSSAEQEEHFFYLLSIADTMRTKLQRMTIPGKKMHQFIGELLDTEVAQRQFAMGSFSYERFFASMGQLLPKLCAPFRDEEVRVLVQETLTAGAGSGSDSSSNSGDYVERLQALHAFIDVMLTDHVNFLISVAAPELLLSATKYETTRFAEMAPRQRTLDASGQETGRGPLLLPAAAAAWRAARRHVMTETARRDPEGVHHPRARPTVTQFYTHMLVDLFTQLRPVPLSAMPEMLLLDYERALRWGAVTRRIVTAGAVLLQAKNLLKRDVRLPWKTEAQRVMAVLERADAEAEAEAEAREQAEAGEQGVYFQGVFPGAFQGVFHSQGASSSEDEQEARPPFVRTLSTVTVDGVVAALESGRSMPPATRAQLRACVQRTLAASVEVSQPVPSSSSSSSSSSSPSQAAESYESPLPQEPVLRLLLHRLRGHLLARLTAASAAEKSRQSSTAGERLTSLGLAEFVDRVRDMMDEVGRIGTIDRETHGAFWEEVAAQVEADEQQQQLVEGVAK